jgi:hypothetical protein
MVFILTNLPYSFTILYIFDYVLILNFISYVLLVYSVWVLHYFHIYLYILLSYYIIKIYLCIFYTCSLTHSRVCQRWLLTMSAVNTNKCMHKTCLVLTLAYIHTYVINISLYFPRVHTRAQIKDDYWRRQESIILKIWLKHV